MAIIVARASSADQSRLPWWAVSCATGVMGRFVEEQPTVPLTDAFDLDF
jgi:hypothetical protein